MRLHLTLTGAMLVILTLSAACGSNYAPTAPASPAPVVAADVTITINGMNGSLSFSPNPATVTAGQTVAWRNGDSVAHTATSDTGAFDTGTLTPGATSAPIMMSATGSLNYHCKIHPSMVGTLTVT
jgi:plastocyanin